VVHGPGIKVDNMLANPVGVSEAECTVYTIGTLLVLIPLPLILAVLLNSGRVVKSTVFRVILFLPALTSLVVVGAVFRLILGREGFLNSVLTTFLRIQPLLFNLARRRPWELSWRLSFSPCPSFSSGSSAFLRGRPKHHEHT
jgi:ABC-type polysaccharide transport system permease subunit